MRHPFFAFHILFLICTFYTNVHWLFLRDALFLKTVRLLLIVYLLPLAGRKYILWYIGIERSWKQFHFYGITKVSLSENDSAHELWYEKPLPVFMIASKWCPYSVKPLWGLLKMILFIHFFRECRGVFIFRMKRRRPCRISVKFHSGVE